MRGKALQLKALHELKVSRDTVLYQRFQPAYLERMESILEALNVSAETLIFGREI